MYSFHIILHTVSYFAQVRGHITEWTQVYYYIILGVHIHVYDASCYAMRQCVCAHCACGWGTWSVRKCKLRPSLMSLCNECFSAWAWAQIDIPKHDRKVTFLSMTTTYVHVHTYTHPENRSLIQSLVLMCLATTHCVWSMYFFFPQNMDGGHSHITEWTRVYYSLCVFFFSLRTWMGRSPGAGRASECMP